MCCPVHAGSGPGAGLGTEEVVPAMLRRACNWPDYIKRTRDGGKTGAWQWYRWGWRNGGVGRAGLGGGSGAEVALYLSGGDQEVVSFVLKNCEYSGATISSSLELSA